MKKASVVGCAIAVSVAVGVVWWFWGTSSSNTAPNNGDKSAAARSTDRTDVLAPDAVLKIRPNAAPAPSTYRNTATVLLKPEPSELQKLFHAGDFKSLLKLAEQNPQSAESLRLTAQVFEICVQPTIFEGLVGGMVELHAKAQELVKAKKPSEKKSAVDAKADFLASLSSADPDYQKRVSAYDRLTQAARNPEKTVNAEESSCAAVKNTKITFTELRELWKSAAEAGDPIARLRQIECGLAPNYSEQSRAKTPEQLAQAIEEGEKRGHITQETLTELRALIALRRDDLAPQVLQILTSNFKNGVFALDEQRLHIKANSIRNDALALVRCDLRMNCEKLHERTMDNACAFQGHCSATTYEDYLRYYVFAPALTQQIEQQRSTLNLLLASGDAQRLRFMPSTQTSDNSSYIGEFGCW